MGKPFKLTGTETSDGTEDPRANVGRADDGKFTKLEQPTSGDILKTAQEEGRPVDDVAREARVPDRLVADEGQEVPGEPQRVYGRPIPWPDDGPEQHHPMKLKG